MEKTETARPEPSESGASNAHEIETATERRTVELEVTETAWSWLVCLASFMMLVIAAGLNNCAGIIFIQLLERYKQSRSETAWVTSLASSSAHLFSILATYFCQVYGCRAVGVVSGLLSAMALLGSAYSPSLQLLYLTYGIGFGLGSSLCYCASLLIIPKYFSQRLSFAISLNQLGAPVGTLVMTPLLQYLFHEMGFRWTMICLAGLQVVVIIAALSFRPVHSSAQEETHNKTQSMHMSLSLFKCKRFLVWLGCLWIFIPAILIPFVHLIRLAEDKGISDSKASYLLYFIAISSAITRPIVGRLSDYCPDFGRRLQFFQMSFLIMSLANFLAPLATGFASLATYSCIFGVFEGCVWSLVYIITFDIVGKDMFPLAVGWLLFLLSFPEVSGPPLAGWIYDVSDSYAVAFYVSGGIMALSALMMFFLIPIKHWSCYNTTKKKSREEVINNNNNIQ